MIVVLARAAQRGSPAYFHSERYYYDGYRRIQEVGTEPIATDSNGKPVQISTEAQLTQGTVSSTVRREYVWDDNVLNPAHIDKEGSPAGRW